MADYTFYTNPMSRGQIVRWALHEAGADYEQQIVEYGPTEGKPAAFIAANPMGKVPTLVHHHGDHDHVVTEAAAICHYLAEMHPDTGLLPEAHEKAQYFRYLFFAAGPVEQAIIANSMGWSVDPQKEGSLGFGSYERMVDAFETMLTGLRRAMLQAEAAGDLEAPDLPSAAALALQCFINQYAYWETV